MTLRTKAASMTDGIAPHLRDAGREGVHKETQHD
jgi:hypothetical protein